MSRPVVVSDTGFVVALFNADDKHHSASIQQYLRWDEILLPQPALTEISYFATNPGVRSAFLQFLKDIPSSKFKLVHMEPSIAARVAELLHIYADTRIDFVDACVMAIAEHYQIETVLTLDRRDFTIVRPVHCESFTLLP
ncbi:MAG: PIN domain-containing protein [Cyanobacteria bacterium P01_C01_bin.89]